jgi:glycine/D-amino acid oxidase-like deaminating enzyme
MRRYDVLILGAGIVGCASALECIHAGLRVAIVEPGAIGGAATAAGMGHIVVMDDSPAQLALTRYSRALWNQLRNQLPLGVEYEQRGTIWVAADEEELNEVHKKQVAYADSGIESQILDAHALADAEPNLRSGLAGGLLVAEDAVIYPPVAAQFFLDQALRAGAELIQGNAARQIAHELVTLEDGSEYGAKWIVVATGADKILLPWLPIEKRKGHLLITDRYPGFLHHQLVELGYLKSAHSIKSDSVAFNIQPRSTGQLLVGSSRQYGNDDPATEAKMLRAMLHRACEYMPALASLSSIRTWTGFRAATPDKLPLIGPTADPSIFLAAGFEGLGITNAPGAARLLVDALLGRTSEIDPSPYYPVRFSSLELNHD